MRKLAAILLFLMPIVFGSARADELTAAKKADIRTLMQLTNASNIPIQIADQAAMQIVQQIQANRGDMTPQAAKGVQEELQSVFKQNANAILDQAESIYANKFTHREAKDVIAFLKSPVGVKFSAAMPVVLRDTMQIGFGVLQSQKVTIETRVKDRLKKEGVDLDKPPPPKPAAPAPGSSPAPAPVPGEKK